MTPSSVDGLERRRGTAAGRRRRRASARGRAGRRARRKCVRPHQRTVQPGRRALEMVAAGDGVVRVEHVAELARDARQLVERDAALGPVEQQPQDRRALLRGGTARRRARAPPPGRGARPAPRRAGSPRPDPSNCCSSQNEKVGGAHFGWSVKAGNGESYNTRSRARNAVGTAAIGTVRRTSPRSRGGSAPRPPCASP